MKFLLLLLGLIIIVGQSPVYAGAGAVHIGSTTSHGGVVNTGSPNVFVNGFGASTAGATTVCPLVTGLVPHIGGPIVGGSTSVFINGLPAIYAGLNGICIGPPSVVNGSNNVFFGF